MITTIRCINFVAATNGVLSNECRWDERIGGVGQVAVSGETDEAAVSRNINPPGGRGVGNNRGGSRALDRRSCEFAFVRTSDATAATAWTLSTGISVWALSLPAIGSRLALTPFTALSTFGALSTFAAPIMAGGTFRWRWWWCGRLAAVRNAVREGARRSIVVEWP